MRIHFRTAASADMRRVARETRAAWGEAQAYIYSRQLRDDITSLAEFPLREREILTFSLSVQVGDSAPHSFTFNQEVFPDE